MRKYSENLLVLPLGLRILIMVFLGCLPNLGQTDLLLPDEVTQQQLRGNNVNKYRVRLEKNEFLQVVLSQEGSDVVLSLIGPDGNRLAMRDSPDIEQGLERLSWVANDAGTYSVYVEAFDKTKKLEGRYRIRRMPSRKASGENFEQIVGEQAFAEAMRLHSSPLESERSKIPSLLLSAKTAFQGIGDSYYATIATMLSVYVSVATNESLNQTDMDVFLSSTKEGLESEAKETRNARLVFEKFSAKRYQTVMMLRLGYINSLLGEEKVALDWYKQAVRLANDAGFQKGAGIAFLAMARTYSALGDNGKALKLLLDAQGIFRRIDEKSGDAIVSLNLGFMYEAGGDIKRALDAYDDAANKAKAGHDWVTYDDAWAAVASIWATGGRTKEAIELYLKILDSKVRTRDVRGRSIILHDIAFAYDHSNENEKALDYYQQSLTLSRTIGDRTGEAVTLNNLMYLLERLDNPRAAILAGKHATNKYQELRASIRSLDAGVQRTFTSSVEGTFQKLADLLITQGRFPEAQQVLNLLKEHEYFDYVRRDPDEIKNLKDRVTLRTDEKKLIERYDLLADLIAQIGTKFQILDNKKNRLADGATLTAAEEIEYSSLSRQLSDANAAFRIFLEKELVFEIGADAKNEIEVDRALQDNLRSWGDGTVALYTIAGEDRLRIVLTTPTVQVDGKTEIKAADLNRKIFAFRAAIQNPAIDPRPLAKELYDILLKPIEKHLTAAEARTLVWSLDGTLRYLPIAALSPDGKSYLIEKYRSVVITSATRQKMAAESASDWSPLGLGVTAGVTVDVPNLPESKMSFASLPGVRAELGKIVREKAGETGLFSGKRLLDDEFNAKNFSEFLSKVGADGTRKFTVVHIASHFSLGADSGTSFLLLGGGETLTLEQISNSPQIRFGDIDLVTLSACSTALGSDGTGKEVDSLATFIELRGAKSVLATLWPVADESTQLLMTEFYRLKKESPAITKAAAIQSAQRAMIGGRLKPSGSNSGCRSPKVFKPGESASFKCDPNAPFMHPYFWAPFVLIGNWR